MLLLLQAAPTPPQIFVGPQVVLSVQSEVVLQEPPRAFAKQFPPLHLPDRHWLLAVHVVPGHEARQRLVVGLQLPLWHWVEAEQGVVLPYGILQIPAMHCRPAAQV